MRQRSSSGRTPEEEGDVGSAGYPRPPLSACWWGVTGLNRALIHAWVSWGGVFLHRRTSPHFCREVQIVVHTL